MSDCITDDWKLNVTPVVRLERPKKTFVISVLLHAVAGN